MPHLEANGQQLYYEAHGDGEPMLCVMGLGADIQSWALQVPAWSKRHKVVVFDNRDVGRSSEADSDYGMADMADDTFALADALELDSFHLVGYSMGSYIAQEMALAAPERLRTLTLCATQGGAGAYARERTRIWTEVVRRISHEDHLDQLMLMTLSERFFEDAGAVEFIRGVIRNNPYPQSTEAFIRQLAAAGRHETRDRLPSLRMPTHVIGAEHDILVPVWKAREVAELIPGARYTEVANAPHSMSLEATEEFNAAVLDFIAANSA